MASHPIHPPGSASAASYLAASEDKLKDVATFIREGIVKAFKSSKEMPWPPTIDDIEKMSTLFAMEMSRTLKNVNRQNILSTQSAKMFVAQYLKDDGNSTSTFLFASL